MKRKAFIFTAATVAIGVPLVYYYKTNRNFNPLSTPYILSTFCSEKDIREIGLTYRNQVPLENDKQKLTDIILTDNSGKKLKPSDKSAIEKLVNIKIHGEFTNSDITIINGWILSVTEARQCALFSFT
jgi:hypothetical protein